MTPPADPAMTAAAGSRSSPLANRLLGWLESGPLARGSRVLVLGSEAAALAPGLRARGHHVQVLETGEKDLGALARDSPGSFDGVVAIGFIERLRWDRWALQQMRRVLRDDGTLLLAVPDLYSLRSLADPRYVAAKIAKLLPSGSDAGMPSRRAREVVRSYAARRLRGMLGRLAYQPLRWSGLGLGSSGLDGRETWPPTHHLVLARKQISSPHADTMHEYEAEHRAFLATRDRWRREHMRPDDTPRPFEPERFARAGVLVLAPHPDDEIIGCGGTLLRLARAGARVTVLQATDGSASAALEDAPDAIRRTMRLDEARAVAEAAGFEPTVFWQEDNRAFRARNELVGRLRETLREMRPALVFTPFVDDIHPDHRTLNRILAAALEALPEQGMRVVGYEVWSVVPANLWCDVSSCTRDVERLLLLYDTAMKVDDLIHMSSARNRAHAIQLGTGAAYAEVFHVFDPARFRELADRIAP